MPGYRERTKNIFTLFVKQINYNMSYKNVIHVMPFSTLTATTPSSNVNISKCLTEAVCLEYVVVLTTQTRLCTDHVITRLVSDATSHAELATVLRPTVSNSDVQSILRDNDKIITD